MIYNNLRKLFFIPSLLTILALASCQKEIDITDPDIIPDEAKDSTLLIKSISLKSFDPSTGLPDDDSIKEDYTYDTLNHKIIITFDQAASSQYYTEAEIEHTYNASGLLTDIHYKYRNGYVPADDDRISVKLSYDADKIIQKSTLHYYNGDIRTTVFNKTVLASGKYQLSWSEPLFLGNGEDTAFVSAIFDETDKLLKNEFSYSYNTIRGSGVDAFTKIIITDSLFYDANGSVTKTVVNYIDTLRDINDTFVGCEFNSRQSKGDQLYNMRQVLLNGIATIPFGEDLFQGGISGILSYFPNGYEPMEYSKYPFQSARVYNSLTKEYDNFTAISEFDSKDRLINFKGFVNDYDLEPYQYEISYYK